MSELKIPKFRTTRSLVKFVRIYKSRLPSDRELVFFSSKESEHVKAQNLVEYASHVGRLPPRFENLLVGDQNLVCDDRLIVNYSFAIGDKLEGDLLDHLKNNSQQLVRYALKHGRLPKHLEDSLTEPRSLVSYAKGVLEGRLPEHLEDRLIGDEYNVEQYALKVIRGLASARLPDSLHNYMVMKSFEDPNNDASRTWRRPRATPTSFSPWRVGSRSSRRRSSG